MSDNVMVWESPQSFPSHFYHSSISGFYGYVATLGEVVGVRGVYAIAVKKHGQLYTVMVTRDPRGWRALTMFEHMFVEAQNAAFFEGKD